MADDYWIWSHGHKVRAPEKSNPLYHLYTLEQLNALTDLEHIIQRWKDEQDAEDFCVERMSYTAP